MGFSIGKVFRPIEHEMKKWNEVDSIYLPNSDYKISSLIKNLRFVKRCIKKKKYDVIHITGTEHYLLPFLSSYNTIVTVHDLGFYTKQKRSLKMIVKYFLWIKTLSYAKYVTFISDFSQQETLRLVHLRKSCVINNPIDPEYQPVQKKFNDKCPCILHIGTKSNKNLFNTIEALKGLSCKLRIIGKLSEDEILHLNKNQINYTNSYNLSDKEIIQEYCKCDIVNFPSLYEGFGMPILEAQAIGRIVITSNIEPMRTIANDAAIIVNPYDIESMRRGYIKAFNFYPDIILKGFENVKKYNVKVIASEYMKVYNKII